ncbi:HTR-like protein [Halodesulfurarchaeum formicicum]|uniref:HTR-like protein n=1 Tax=Halodesulfurarchaeum formicicum TaxID=1873524 RepID=A0A1D8S2S3_9EURY|nr:DUF106 domain-containing protein [Halodesulfurarchaeum formicicum]AOW79657.1 HTR-like protein [Halodesulfurarchaeum formicicum]APE94908.1 HTR-like protein [Halodesulfurarchaeum formicicum]
MNRTAEKVADLVRENPEFEAVLSELLDREDELRWRDVKDDMTSGQWGRLLQKDILVEGEDGFQFADREAVEEALGRTDEMEFETDVDVDDSESSWSTYDKAAAVGALGMFAGYSVGSVRSAVGNVLDLFLGPLDSALPFFAVIMVLAVVTGLYSSILQNALMDTEKMGAYQEKMKEIQERQKAAKERGDDEAVERIREEQMDAMGDQLGMFKEQLRPMVWIMVITIPVFLWMYWKIRPPAHINPAEASMVMPMVGEVELAAGVVGPLQAWILWYILNSIGFSQIIRKALNIQTSPT